MEASTSTPTRIQLRRTKGWRLPPNTVVVSRPSKWGNPYKVGIDGDAKSCVAQYAYRMRHPFFRDAIIASLRGKNLGCWCPLGQPCHADVLLELANTP